MCLYTKESLFSTATEDITCYKILTVDSGGKFETPYQHTPVDNDVILGEKPFDAKGFPSIYEQWNVCSFFSAREFKYFVTSGMIHTYVSKPWVFPNTCLFECIIPKGTRFTFGIDSCGDYCFASEKFVFKKQISGEGRFKRNLENFFKTILKPNKNV